MINLRDGKFKLGLEVFTPIKPSLHQNLCFCNLFGQVQDTNRPAKSIIKKRSFS